MRHALVLQLHILPAFVVGLRGAGLVSSSPERPCDDQGCARWWSEQEAGEQVADFRDAGHQRDDEGQAAVRGFGLVLFALLQAARRRSAASLARKAPATITRLIWRCQPCQERASQ